MNAPILIMTFLLVINGLLALTLGNIVPGLLLLCGMITMMVLPRGRDRARGLLGFLFAGCIFISGAPIAGGHAVTLLVTTVGAIHFLTWLLVYHDTSDQPTFGVGIKNHDLLFTISFYSCLILAYLFLRMDVFPVMNDVAHQICGVILVVMAFAVWELGRRSRLRRADMTQSTTVPDRVTRICIALGLLIAAILLFRHPLPSFANGAVDFAERLNLTHEPPEPPKREGAPEEEEEELYPQDQSGPQHPLQSDQTSSEQAGSGGDGPGSLPSRADLQPQMGARLQIAIEDPVAFQRLVAKPTYVRSFTFETFDEEQWTASPEPSQSIADDADGDRDGIVTLKPSRGDEIWHHVFIVEPMGDTLSALAGLEAVELPELKMLRESNFQMPNQIRQWRARSAIVHFDDLLAEELLPGRDGQHFHHLQVPGTKVMRDLERNIVQPLTQGEEGLTQKLLQLREYARTTYRYSLKIDNPNDLPALENFLFHEKKGYCDFFASAGALMARMLGVPSRVAYGYSGGSYDAGERTLTYQGDDGHSWTEIYLDGYGWVIYDLTPVGEGARTPAEEMVPQEQAEVAPVPQAEEEEPVPDEPEMITRPVEQEWKLRDQWFFKNLDWLLGGLLILLVAIYVYRKMRKDAEKEGDEVKNSRKWGPVPAYVRELYLMLDRVGVPYTEGDTLKEMEDTLRERGVIQDDLSPIVRYHYHVRYENGERAKDKEKQFQRQIREFIRSLPSGPDAQSDSASVA